MAQRPNKRRRSNLAAEYTGDSENVTASTGTWLPGQDWWSTYNQSSEQQPDEHHLLSSVNRPTHQTQIAPAVYNGTHVNAPSAAYSQLRPDAPTFTPQRSSPQLNLFPDYDVALPTISAYDYLDSSAALWPVSDTFVDSFDIDASSWQLPDVSGYQPGFPVPHNSSDFTLPYSLGPEWNTASWQQLDTTMLTPPASSHGRPSYVPATRSMRQISQTLGQLPTPTSTDRMLGEAHTVEDPNRVTGQLPPAFLPDTPTPAGRRRAPLSQSGSHSCTHTEGPKPCVKIFETKAELNKHQRSHLPLEDRPFKCNDCNANFNYLKDLTRHLNTKSHRKRTPALHSRTFLCPVPRCEGRFTRKDNFRRHRESAHGDLPDVEPIVMSSSPVPSARSSVAG